MEWEAMKARLEKGPLAEFVSELDGWRTETVALRDENARLRRELAEEDSAVDRLIRKLGVAERERDEARALLSTGPWDAWKHAEAEVARLEGLILDFNESNNGSGLRFMAEARRICDQPSREMPYEPR